ncbi:MAG: RimK/LysX family protein [Vicingaceae bacterium]
MKKKTPKCIVGRTELVEFPEFGLSGIDAKIDTGAYSTAIHAHKTWIEEKEGVEYLNFELLDPEKEQYRKLTIRTSNFFRKKVRSSNGRLEQRFAIKTKIILGGKKRLTDLTLTNRGKMRYPVLVGRKVLKKGFLVDVSKKNDSR